MSKRRKPDWKAEQEAAELARQQAQNHLKEKGVAWNETSRESLRDKQTQDNTLELVRQRKAQKLLLGKQEQQPQGSTGRHIGSSAEAASRNQGYLANLSKSSESRNTSVTAALDTAGLLIRPPHGWTIDDMLVIDEVLPRGKSHPEKVFRHLSSGCVLTQAPLKGKGPDATENLGIILPRGWKVLKDPSTSRYYFWNFKTNKVQYELVEEDNQEPVGSTQTVKSNEESGVKLEPQQGHDENVSLHRSSGVQPGTTENEQIEQTASLGIGIKMKLGLKKRKK